PKQEVDREAAEKVQKKVGQAERPGGEAEDAPIGPERQEEKRARLVGRVAVGEGRGERGAGTDGAVLLDPSGLIVGERGGDRGQAGERRNEVDRDEGEDPEDGESPHGGAARDGSAGPGGGG